MNSNPNPKALNCEAVRENLPDWLSDELPAAERTAFDAHLAGCADCRQELAATRQLWQQMSAVRTPEPSPAMRTQFYALLETFEEAEKKAPKRFQTSIPDRLRHLWTPAFSARLAYSLLLLTVGAAAGHWLNRPQAPERAYQQQIDSLSGQVQEMRQMMMLTLLENPSATERLRAVSYTKEINDADGRVIDALLTTLNNDPNVNVRLVTLEALADMAHDPRVREGLVHALTQQDSPLVQVALADVMVKLQEKRSLKPLRQLLRREGINDLVKSKIEQTIRDLS